MGTVGWCCVFFNSDQLYFLLNKMFYPQILKPILSIWPNTHDGLKMLWEANSVKCVQTVDCYCTYSNWGSKLDWAKFKCIKNVCMLGVLCTVQEGHWFMYHQIRWWSVAVVVLEVLPLDCKVRWIGLEAGLDVKTVWYSQVPLCQLWSWQLSRDQLAGSVPRCFCPESCPDQQPYVWMSWNWVFCDFKSEHFMQNVFFVQNFECMRFRGLIIALLRFIFFTGTPVFSQASPECTYCCTLWYSSTVYCSNSSNAGAINNTKQKYDASLSVASYWIVTHLIYLIMIWGLYLTPTKELNTEFCILHPMKIRKMVKFFDDLNWLKSA